MPPAKQNQPNTQTEETKQNQPNTQTEETPAAAALTKGEHNPFLQGILYEGKAAEEAIKGWYATRDALRTQARMAVQAGFASKDQAQAVADLWPMPKRKKKGEGETAQETPAAA